MDAKTVGDRLRGRIKRLVDRMRHAIQGKGEEYSLPIADCGVDGEVVPGVSRRPRARDRGRRPLCSGRVPHTEYAFVVRALHGELVPLVANVLVRGKLDALSVGRVAQAIVCVEREVCSRSARS
jgi:hypothetical protein